MRDAESARYMVIAGIDGDEPPTDVQKSTENLIETAVSDETSVSLSDVSVHLVTEPTVMQTQSDELGETALYKQNYSIQIRSYDGYKQRDDVSSDSLENIVRTELGHNGYTVAGMQSYEPVSTLD